MLVDEELDVTPLTCFVLMLVMLAVSMTSMVVVVRMGGR
jgi:hypothetical protein